MSRPRLAASHRTTDEGAEVLAPTVGWWIDPPSEGSAVGPESPVGGLRQLGRRYDLVLADVPFGRVAGAPRVRSVAVGYGDVLFRIVAATARPGAAREANDAPRTLASGTHAVVAPSHGVYWRRPSPDAPAFVEVGTSLGAGQPVGLVEVMKTFNQILYGGAGLPERAVVVAIRCEDGAEVRAGDTLLVVRPA
jgi:acetyl-CoA carboxylase biotin carboxyl carrier protein